MNREEENRMIGIRADGNSQIGMGHLMRCLSMAEALQTEGCEVIFFTADEASGNVVRERGFACKVLGTAFDSMEEETEVLTKQIKQNNIEMLLVDSYQVTSKYLENLNTICPVFYLDDMGMQRFPVSGVINYNICGTDLPYEKMYAEKTAFLLGSKYAPVRAEFRNTPYTVREQVKNILITMGGSDSLNISGTLCERLLEELPADVGIRVVCGRFNPHLWNLQKMAQTEKRMEIFSDVKDMWNCFADADIVIAAAGSTMYELATMGVPTVCCYYAENQRQLAEGFAARCEMINAGDYSAEKEAVIGTITAEVLRLVKDARRRRDLSRSMKKVTDGEGAKHLARELMRYMEEENEK